LRQIALGHEEGVSALLEDGPNVAVVRLAAKFGLLVLDLRAQVLAELGEKVLLPMRFGNPEADGLQVTIDQVRGVP